MADLKATLKLDGLGKVESDLKKTSKAAGELGDELDDVAKQKLSALMSVADHLEAELHDNAAAAEALGNALGPELAAKAGGVDAIIADFKQLGLSAKAVEENVEAAADVVRKMDSVAPMVRNVGDEFDKTSTKADQSRSVVANFAGNAAQELPGVAGAFGPLNMAISQFVEYGAEGGVSLKKMLAGGLALGAVSLVIKGITDELGKAAKIDAWKKDQVEDYTDALLEAEDATTAIVDLWTKNRRIEWIQPITGDVKDLTPVLHKAGMTADDFFKIIEGGGPAIEEWKSSTAASKLSEAERTQVLFAAVEAAGSYAQANKDAATSVDVYGDAVKDNTTAVDNGAAAAKRAADATDAQRTALERQTDALEAAYEAERSAVDNKYRYARAARDAGQDIAAMNATLADSKASAEAQQAAVDNAADSILNASADYATLNGAAIDSSEGIARQVESLQNVTSTLEPGSPLRTFLEGYIADLNGIKANVNTTITTTYLQKGERSATVADASYAPWPGGWDGNVKTAYPRAGGGGGRAGQALIVGDRGGLMSPSTELFIPKTDGTVANRDQLRRLGVGDDGLQVQLHLNVAGNIYGDQALMQQLDRFLKDRQTLTRLVRETDAIRRGG